VAVGAALGGLVYAVRETVDGFDLDLDFDLPQANSPTVYSADATRGRVPLWATPTGDTPSSAPVAAEGRVFVRTRAGEVAAFDAATGTAHWSVDVGGSPIAVDFPPVVREGTVFVVGGIGLDERRTQERPSVVALDAASGALRWSTPVDGLGGFPLTVADDAVYVDGPQLFSLDRATGAVRWSVPVGNDAMSGYSQPVVVGGSVVVGGGDGRVRAIDRATGQVRWTSLVGAGRTVGAGPSLAATADTIYAVAADVPGDFFRDEPTTGSLTALDPMSGETRWSRPLRGLSALGSTPTVSGTTVYVAASTFSAFDTATGAPRWDAATGGTTSFSFTPPAVDANTVYAPGGDGRLHAIDATTGAVRWHAGEVPPCPDDASCEPPVPLPPGIGSGVLYLASGDQRLYAYAPGPWSN
jgi:outer membrane protein assembly factor BamB